MQGVCSDPAPTDAGGNISTSTLSVSNPTITTCSSTATESAYMPILYYNARSIIPKFDELCALVEIHSPKLICIVETWLCDSIANSELSIPNYELIRLD